MFGGGRTPRCASIVDLDGIPTVGSTHNTRTGNRALPGKAADAQCVLRRAGAEADPFRIRSPVSTAQMSLDPLSGRSLSFRFRDRLGTSRENGGRAGCPASRRPPGPRIRVRNTSTTNNAAIANRIINPFSCMQIVTNSAGTPRAFFSGQRSVNRNTSAAHQRGLAITEPAKFTQSLSLRNHRDAQRCWLCICFPCITVNRRTRAK